MKKKEFKIIRYENNNYTKINDKSVVECKLEIYVNNRLEAVRLCLNEDLENMIIGFLLTEKYISTYEDVEKIQFIN